MDRISINRFIYRIRHKYLTTNNVVIAMAILVALGWAWGSIEAMQKNYELQRSVDIRRQQLEIEKLKVALLEYESQYYESDEYKELAVRQRLGKGLSGERQVIVSSTDEMITSQSPTATTGATRTDSNFQQWMNFIFGSKQRR